MSLNDIKINNEYIGLPKVMKMLNFVEDVGHFTRGFTRVYVENNTLFIGHTINKNKTKINYNDLDSWIKYFDRI